MTQVEEWKLKLENEFKKYNQEHVFKFWSQLEKEEKLNLLSDLEKINLKDLSTFYETSIKSLDQINEEKITPLKDSENIENIFDMTKERREELEKIGMDSILEGKVG
jgi:capsule polysaccharide export protein KpsE/RkpR